MIDFCKIVMNTGSNGVKRINGEYLDLATSKSSQVSTVFAASTTVRKSVLRSASTQWDIGGPWASDLRFSIRI